MRERTAHDIASTKDAACAPIDRDIEERGRRAVEEALRLLEDEVSRETLTPDQAR